MQKIINSSPRKPTPTPLPPKSSYQELFKDRRTPMPQGQSLIQGPTSTSNPPIPTTPYQPSLIIDVEVDWSQVDWVDAGIDIVGLTANGVNIGATLAGAPEIGVVVDSAASVIEFGGLIKAGIDMAQGDVENLKLLLATDSSKQLALLAKAERAIPYVGFFGNALSLWFNLKPTISIDVR